ncbi:exported hypothetical protein [Frankia sp. AiPs1]
MSAGSCIHRLRMPVATVVRFVAASSAPTASRTGPPTSGIHSASKPSSSSSAAASAASAGSPHRRWKLHTPMPERSIAAVPSTRPSRAVGTGYLYIYQRSSDAIATPRRAAGRSPPSLRAGRAPLDHDVEVRIACGLPAGDGTAVLAAAAREVLEGLSTRQGGLRARRG